VAAPDVQDGRPGFALLATVVVMVLVGTVVTFGFYNAPTAWPQQTSPAEQAAIEAAEAGVRAVIDEWDTARLARLPARGDTTIVGGAETIDAVDYVVSIGRSGPAQFTITSTGAAGEVDRATYCTVVVRTRLKSGRLAERGAALDRTCREAL
jgi:type II secretory pathway pseudopilin PulG